jgi:M6 family metalloprotease-like protein
MERKLFRIAASLTLIVTLPLCLLATPIHPEMKALIESGQIPPPYAYENSVELHNMGVDAPMPVSLSGGELDIYSFSSLALLAGFADMPPATPPPFYDNLIFTPSPWTVHDYFREVSYQEFQLVTGNLPSSTGWYNLPQLYSWYVNGQNGLGTYPQNCQKMVEDVVALADPFVNFAQYDHDGNGSVDGLVVVHAGTDGAWSGSSNDVWSHAWTLPAPFWTADGVYISSYAMVPEFYNGPGDLTPGVIAHEMGHSVLGLPDLYDTDYSSLGLGYWSLMSFGMWNGPMMMGGSPSHLDAWSRIEATFIAPDNVFQDMPGFLIGPVELSPQIWRMWTNGAYGNEYFLVENRQLIGFDSFLPGSELLVYHIDDNVNTWNNNEWYPGYTAFGHYRIALEQADGLWHLEQNINMGDPTDPYPGAMGVTFFDPVSWPNSDDYNGNLTSVGCINMLSMPPIVGVDLIVGNPPPATPPAWIVSYPLTWPVFIPSGGGSFNYDIIIYNNLVNARTGQLWWEAILPNGNNYYISQQTITIQPWVPWQSMNRSQFVPMMAPPGPYQFVLKVGYYPGFVATSFMFPFTKQALVADGDQIIEEWSVEVPMDENGYIASAEPFGPDMMLPTEFAVSEAWPNPFNARARVMITLPEAANLTVSVYNTLGQQVAEVADNHFAAGQHTLTIDAEDLASGMYILSARSGSDSVTRKLVLMK